MGGTPELIVGSARPDRTTSGLLIPVTRAFSEGRVSILTPADRGTREK
jgi:hypothetical protein